MSARVKKGKFLRKLGLSFYAKIEDSNGLVTIRLSSIKRKIFNFLTKAPVRFKSIYLRVTYKPGIINEGKYKSDQIDEMWNAWRSFTDEGLIKDALTY